MIVVLNKIKKAILDALFSPICAVCRKNVPPSENFVCRDCLSLIEINRTFFCPICRARLPENKKICHFDCPYVLAAASNYDNAVVQNVIHLLKYKQIKGLAPILAEIIFDYLKNLELNFENFVIVPVPLHKRKEFSRGFNQSRLIAENISQKLNISFHGALKRIKNNKAQAGLKDHEKRKENVQNCFAAEKPEEISGKNVILIDDVFTSGATMNEAVKVLKSAGAKKIIALVAAKA